MSTGFTRVAAPSHPTYADVKGRAGNANSRGLTVNAVMPGVTKTDMNAEYRPAPGVSQAVPHCAEPASACGCFCPLSAKPIGDDPLGQIKPASSSASQMVNCWITVSGTYP
ncbi:hypothetical protein EMEDMD4_950003 [Sinorhizobium medicae]|uniref:Uncharacterized protein n=1 Tax=Sinorhizobium medicae TaxID=110321 RepID=A0A508X8X5_9HYPH|nr:hypothetical protein EMEDMD4_950003 [Sinorhizobium medicae]